MIERAIQIRRRLRSLKATHRAVTDCPVEGCLARQREEMGEPSFSRKERIL